MGGLVMNPQLQGQSTVIPPTLSIYLDLVRFVAAVCVVLYHSWAIFFPDSKIKWPGHEAVVVFFVLSGYVIAHATMRPNVTASTYIIHRLARIVPVAWLALLLAVPLALVLVPNVDLNETLRSTALNALFIAQSGWAFVEAPLNPPFWSLNYEVWYYVIFGCWIFAPRRWRVLLTCFALLGAGPKIVFLFPVWLYGVWLYRRMPRFGVKLALLVFFITMVAGGLGTWLNISDHLRSALYTAFPPAWRLHYSTQFLYDLTLGMVVTLNFAAVAALAPLLSVSPKLAKVIRVLSGYTFSLYVFHSPLLELLTKGLHIYNPLLFYPAMALCVYLLGQLTELRTHWFRELFTRMMKRYELKVTS
jgi:peptidoglycan/LPS O-acetylase OafA/YrhL